MKRTLLSLAIAALFAAQPLSAQSPRLSFSTTIGTAIPTDASRVVPLLWRVAGHYNPTERWSLGAGTGLSFYRTALLPLYGDVRYQIGRERRLTPFAECAAGYSFSLSGSANGGFMLAPSVGVSRRLTKKVVLQFSAGYELQKIERLREHRDKFFEKQFAEKLTHGGVSISAGVKF